LVSFSFKGSNFIKNYGQSLLSLSFNLFGILAGTLLVLNLDVLSLAKWSFMIFPGILSVRGSIGGLLSGRLSTALQLGTIRVSFLKNTRRFYILICTVVILTLESSLVLGAFSSIFTSVFLYTSFNDFIAIQLIITATLGISLLIISPLTYAISVMSFKGGLNPDVITYPIISTVADVLVTLCYVFLLKLYFTTTLFGSYAIWIMCLIFLVSALYITFKVLRESDVVQAVREFSLTLMLVVFIVTITGTFFQEISRIIGFKPEIYLLYPAVIDTVGDVGSIIGSTTTTKLALGSLDALPTSIRSYVVEISSAWAASITLFILYSIISCIVTGITVRTQVMRFVSQLLITNMLAVSLITSLSFLIAVFTYKRGWDPDNFVIPLESALADGITTFALLIALKIL